MFPNATTKDITNQSSVMVQLVCAGALINMVLNSQILVQEENQAAVRHKTLACFSNIVNELKDLFIYHYSLFMANSNSSSVFDRG